MTPPSAPVAPSPDNRFYPGDPDQRFRTARDRLGHLPAGRAAPGRPGPSQGPALGVPAFCAALGISSYLNPYNTGDVAAQLALIVAFTLPLLWRERLPMLVFALTTAASVVALPWGC